MQQNKDTNNQMAATNVYILTDPDYNNVNKYKVGITSKDQDSLSQDYMRYVPEANVIFFQNCPKAREAEVAIQKELSTFRIKNTRGNLSEWYRYPLDKLRRVVKKHIKAYSIQSVEPVEETPKESLPKAQKPPTPKEEKQKQPLTKKQGKMELTLLKTSLKTVEGSTDFIKSLNKLAKNIVPEEQSSTYWGEGKVKRYDILWKKLAFLTDVDNVNKSITQKWAKEVCERFEIKLVLN